MPSHSSRSNAARRIDLSDELLSIHNDDMPKPDELPRHIASLFDQKGRLERNEIVQLVKIAKEDDDALRAAYVLGTSNVNLGFTFSTLLNPNILEENQYEAFRKCLIAWAGVGEGKVFENLWSTFEERPEVFTIDPKLPRTVLELLSKLHVISPETDIVASSTSDSFLREGSLRVRELPMIEMILSKSKVPAEDLAFLTDPSRTRPSRKALAEHYAEGHKEIAHQFVFTERIIGELDDEDAEAESGGALILDPSNMPGDIPIRDIIAKRDRFEFLKRSDKRVFTPEQDFIVRAIDALSKHPEVLDPEERNLLINDLYDIPEEVQELALTYLDAACSGGAVLANLRGAFASLASRSKVPAGTSEILELAASFPSHKLNDASAVIEDIFRGHSDVSEFIPFFEKGEIAPLIREVYIRRMKEHQAKFPEKPLEEVREAFANPGEEGFTEIASQAARDLAFDLYERIHTEGESLVGAPRGQLVQELKALTSEMRAKEELEVSALSETSAEGMSLHENHDHLVRYMALSRELFREHFGVYPYNTQVVSALLLITADSVEERMRKGIYSQVKTGEGKSLLTTLLAGYYGVSGRRVDVITSNIYLAGRDAQKFADYYADQGLTCISHEHGSVNGSDGEDPSIIYSTNADMIFTYLHSRLEGGKYFAGKRFDLAIVDEADNLCLDLGEESVRIAGEVPQPFNELQFRSFIAFMDGPGKSLYPSRLDEAVEQFKDANPDVAGKPAKVLWMYLYSAARSAKMVRDEDYIISKDNQPRIVLVDKDHTGRLKTRSQWQHGVYEFVTLREGLDLRPATGLQAQKHHPDFLKMYDRMCCISGTFGDEVEREELQEIYDLLGFDAPPHHASKRVDLPVEVYRTREELTDRLDEILSSRLNENLDRPALVLAKTIEQSKFLSDHLRLKGRQHQLMNGESTRDALGAKVTEERVVAEAGKARKDTLSTNLSGRGTDIVLDKDAETAGGLISVQTSYPVSQRVEIQGRGRAGRQGQDGTSIVIACLEDDEFLKQLPVKLEYQLDTFGNDTPELQKLLDYARQSSNLAQGLRRRCHAQNEEAVQELQEYFFTKLEELSDRLGKVNRRMKKIEGMPGIADPLSMAVTTVWGPVFQEFDLDLKMREIRFQMKRMSGGQNEFIETEATKRLDQIFEKVYGKTYEDLDPEIHLEGVLGAFHRFNRRLINNVEAEIEYSDPKALMQMVHGAQAKVDHLIEDMFTRLEWRGRD